MRSFEWATLAYCAYTCAAALVRPGLTAARRAAIAGSALALGALAAWAPRAPWHDVLVLRDWFLPGAVYLLFGYRLSGLFYVAPMPRPERWLVRLDVAIGAAGWTRRVPLPIAEFLEFSYFSVYALIAAGAPIAYVTSGTPAVDRFWTIVLAADYICFACMPWVQTRTPRALEGEPPTSRSRVRGLNLAVLRIFSHDRNTFPSGHAAEAAAVVLALARHAPAASLALLPLAVGVGVGSVAGRYHFAADAIAGYIVAILVWLAVP